MAGTTCTFTEEFEFGIRKIKLSWLSDDAAGTVAGTVGAIPEKVQGLIQRVVTVPGSPAPTDLYDIVLNDANGADVMNGALANRSTSAVENINVAGQGIRVSDFLTMVIANAGNAKRGSLILYVQNR